MPVCEKDHPVGTILNLRSPNPRHDKDLKVIVLDYQQRGFTILVGLYVFGQPPRKAHSTAAGVRMGGRWYETSALEVVSVSLSL